MSATNRHTVTYTGSAPGMGTVVRHFRNRAEAETWARQVGVFDRAKIEDAEARERINAAAPDLLAALETLIASLEWEENRSGTTYNGFDTARRAIAKAKGE